jgi:hypothetical protein
LHTAAGTTLDKEPTGAEVPERKRKKPPTKQPDPINHERKEEKKKSIKQKRENGKIRNIFLATTFDVTKRKYDKPRPNAIIQ